MSQDSHDAIKLRPATVEITHAMLERTMEAIAAEFGACSDSTARRVLAAALAETQEPVVLDPVASARAVEILDRRTPGWDAPSAEDQS